MSTGNLAFQLLIPHAKDHYYRKKGGTNEMGMLGTLLMLVGGIIGFIAGIMLLVVAFQENLFWGLVVLLAPFGSLFFLVKHWKEGRRPFWLSMSAAVIYVMGHILILAAAGPR